MDKRELKKLLTELSDIKGRHTELVSVYIPAGYDIIKIIKDLQQEQDTASNIKSKENRKRVQDSLERMIRHLRLFKKNPDNGLAIFSGNASKTDSKVDIQVWSVEPPEPVQTRLYRCDQTFVLDPLKDILEIKEVYGLILVDNREGTIGYVKGKLIKEVTKMTSGVPGKIHAGGQCISPTSKITTKNGIIPIDDVQIGDYILGYDFINKSLRYTKCIDKWQVLKDNNYEITVSNYKLLASEGHYFFSPNGKTKQTTELKIGDKLALRNSIVEINDIQQINGKTNLIDISVEGRNFYANNILVHNSAPRFARLREIAAHEFYQRIGSAANKEFENLENLKGILIGGPGPTKETFADGDYLHTELKKKVIGIRDLSYTGEFGLNELVEKSQDLLAQQAIIKEKKLLQKFFELLGKNPGLTVYGEDKTRKALEKGGVDILILSEKLDEKLAEELEELANQYGTNIEFVSTETKEGEQFNELSGIAGILRYKIDG